MCGALFGPAGNSDSFKQRYHSSGDIPQYVSEMGLTAFEYQFGRGVRIQPSAAAALKEGCEKHQIEMSAHAPYYISLASEEEAKRQNSIGYMLQTARAVAAMGGRRFVVHCGSPGGRPRREALLVARDTLIRGLAAMDEAGFSDITVCPETMGKQNQLGDLWEVLLLCKADERLLPCIDFGHLNARSRGGIKTAGDYAAILTALENSLGRERASSFHSHFSKIEYTDMGEKKHLTFADTVFGPEPGPLMALVAERGYSPHFICESDGTQAEDAVSMFALYAAAATNENGEDKTDDKD